ncbi:unnamed protein product [Rotaria magnacalcarata]|uniref:Uncharacterized protein n=1 Tax=Rotaria magnacalcarata TaxID=392030 RepID=A0A815M0L3_9BILA|nr:unnamed protein product [Rotaria magnacalcarata]CAF1411230.1 unnamed protein product [Rotaria magnacalcarata]CAF1945836.1 unnamed protein product [Rotaria magnacalcarata]CAF3902084.1 unnamed protein product [Rotaria magnacalcarata]CAF3919122.1 unnamed protein product [Rotaria magnacalcarata]
MASNDERGLINDTESMNYVKSSVLEEEGQMNSERTDFCGPSTLFVCMHFIMMREIITTVSDDCGAYLEAVFKIILLNNEILDNELDQLQTFANKFGLNFYISIIDRNQNSFRHIKTSTIKKDQHRAYLVFDKSTRDFYTFYVHNINNKNRTIFSVNDTHILKLFEDLMSVYQWPNNSDTTIQVPLMYQEKTPTSNMSQTEDDVGQPILKSSDLCNLLVRNVQSLTNIIGPQLDNLNLSFKSAEYQLNDGDLSSPEAATESLQHQLQILSKLADMAAKSCTTNRKTSTSIESSESSESSIFEKNTPLNNHDQDIISNSLIRTRRSFSSRSQSTTVISTDSSTSTPSNLKEEIKLSKPKLLNQPTRFWHHRTLKELRDKRCPAVTAEGCGQRAGLLLKFGDDIKTLEEEVYLGVHAVTYDKQEHDQRFVVPMNTSVAKNINLKTNNLNEFIIVDNKKPYDEFDFTTKGAFLKMNPKNLQKKCNFKMVNLYQSETISKDIIENKKLKWSRLMFAFYIKLSDGQFTRVSPPTFSDLIKETNGAQSVETDSIFPNKFCERGGQMIFVQLNGVVKKCNLHVTCNGRELEDSDFQIAEQILSFESPARTQGIEHLHVKIFNKNTNLSIDYQQPYYLHDDHPDPCEVVN